MNKNTKTYILTIIGKVQNVGFRYWFYQEAINLELKGYIKNLSKINLVESVIQGKLYKIIDIIEKSKKGPRFAIVEKIISEEIITNTIYDKFLIK